MSGSRSKLRIAAVVAALLLPACGGAVVAERAPGELDGRGALLAPEAREDDQAAPAEESGRPREAHGDARTALAAASPGLKTCQRARGPRAVEVALRFEPNGKVSRVDVEPAGEVAACVRERLARIEILPFRGASFTVRERIWL